MADTFNAGEVFPALVGEVDAVTALQVGTVDVRPLLNLCPCRGVQ